MKANFLNEKVLFIFVICASFVLTRSHSFWSEIPQGLHVWTQTDRLALAQRFGEERSQLIYPRTYNLKPNHHSNKISEDGITAVDFPLPEYVAGTLSRYTGQSVTLILRITYSLFFCIGLYLLYVQLRLHGLSFLRAYAVIGLIFTSPVVFYYSAGMLPSTVAFSFSLAGYAFVNLGKSRAQFSRVLQGLALLVLAGMIRTPYYLNLAIVLLFLFILPMVKGKAPSKRMMIGVFILIIPAVSWWIWNISLRNTFGSMFLGRPLIPNSFSEGFSFLVNSINTWKWDYVAYVHVIIAGIGVFVLLIRSFSVLIRDFYFLAACLSFVLGILYAFLMAKQFVHHDYYAIDAFAIPFFLILICVFAKMDRLPKFLEGVLFFTALLFAGFHLHGKHAERSFIGSWDRTFHVNRAFLNSKQLLDSLSIPSNANMLVLDAYSTNGPLLLLNRKGFTIMNTSEDELRKSLKLPFDYIAIADKFLLSDVLQYSNEMQSQLFR